MSPVRRIARREQEEVNDGIAEQDVQSDSHPSGATRKRDFPEVLAVCKARALPSDEDRRYPNYKDPEMQIPDQVPSRNCQPSESHAVRGDAQTETGCGEKQ